MAAILVDNLTPLSAMSNHLPSSQSSLVLGLAQAAPHSFASLCEQVAKGGDSPLLRELTALPLPDNAVRAICATLLALTPPLEALAQEVWTTTATAKARGPVAQAAQLAGFLADHQWDAAQMLINSGCDPATLVPMEDSVLVSRVPSRLTLSLGKREFALKSYAPMLLPLQYRLKQAFPVDFDAEFLGGIFSRREWKRLPILANTVDHGPIDIASYLCVQTWSSKLPEMLACCDTSDPGLREDLHTAWRRMLSLRTDPYLRGLLGASDIAAAAVHMIGAGMELTQADAVQFSKSCRTSLIHSIADAYANVPLRTASGLAVLAAMHRSGVDMTAKRSGMTLLHVAAVEDNAELARLCLDMGLDPHQRSDSGNTALEIAAEKQSADVHQMLLALDARASLATMMEQLAPKTARPD